jgi:MtN3 and saliva related transmembrane protein
MADGSATLSLLGFSAGFLTTMAGVPQVLKSWRTRSVQDLSIVMLGMLTLGLLLWIAYGVARSDWPIIMTNACSFVLWSSLLVLKLRGGPSGQGA